MGEKQKKEAAALLVCREKAQQHGLKIRLIDAEYQFDGNKVTFYFTADKRVDFREMVRDLAAIYKARIDMRQIGARDAARRLDGYGVCGRRLCCTEFMRDFDPIPAKAAEEQHLTSPNRTTGLCGRLKCCLRYEQDFYTEATDRFPKPGMRIPSPRGCCTVCKCDIFHNKVAVCYEDGGEETLPVEEIDRLRRSEIAA